MVELLPINAILDGEELSIIPKIIVSYASLKTHRKVDRFEVFCLFNQNNPLVKTALENFFLKQATSEFQNHRKK